MEPYQITETNLVIKGFLQLPQEEKQEIYDLLFSGGDCMARHLEVGLKFMGMLTPHLEILQLQGGRAVDFWDVSLNRKLVFFVEYFMNHIKKTDDETFSIELIPEPKTQKG